MRPWLIELPTCPSTNTWALDHAEALCHGAVVWTKQQTLGRGRGTSRWLAPNGVLTVTVVLHQPEPLPQLSLAAGLAVVHAAEDLCPGLRLGLKWPNDVWLNGRKIAGVLCERADDRVAVGIGLNRDPHWDASPESLRLAVSGQPASLAESGTVPDELALIDGLRRYVVEAAGLLHAQGFAPLAAAWRERDALVGESITVEDGPRVITGTALGIDDQGRLRVKTDTGETPLIGGHVVR